MSSSRLKLLQLARFLLESHSLVLIQSDFLQSAHSSYLLSIVMQNLKEKTLIAVIEDSSLLSSFDESITMEKGTIVDVQTISKS